MNFFMFKVIVIHLKLRVVIQYLKYLLGKMCVAKYSLKRHLKLKNIIIVAL